MLSRGFWLADTACTQALWQAVTGAKPSYFKDDARNPVENVSWDEVQAFLSELNRRVPGLQARLPSEAEWEYACRAGTTTPFSFGDNITPEQVNYDGNYPYAGGEKGLYRQKTVPAGSLPANPWGLYEMHGNVWEWCADWYGDYPNTPQVDPTGPQTGASRVLRGGSWTSTAGTRVVPTATGSSPATAPCTSGSGSPQVKAGRRSRPERSGWPYSRPGRTAVGKTLWGRRASRRAKRADSRFFLQARLLSSRAGASTSGRRPKCLAPSKRLWCQTNLSKIRSNHS
jgi:hypothetical protein